MCLFAHYQNCVLRLSVYRLPRWEQALTGHKSLDSYLILNKAVCRSLGVEILIRVFAPDSFLSAVVACRSLQSVPCLRFDPPLCRGCVCLRAAVPKGIIRIVY
jgi:hypothetical protein